MARQLSIDVNEGVKQLITKISKFEEGSETFESIQKYVLNQIKKSGTMYFLNKKEVDQTITGMAEKFNFHGFFKQSEALQNSYDNYLPSSLSKSILINRLNVVKFLMCMSESPTTKFLLNPEEFVIEQVKEEDSINWGEYLNEGIEQWNVNNESSECSETSSELFEDTNDVIDSPKIKPSCLPMQIESNDKDVVVDLRINREELLNTIQHSWYHQDVFIEKPFSKAREANVGILWESFLEREAMGLIKFPKSSVLSEYKVIREILWQLWKPHSSAVFEIQGNNIVAKSNITISSVRSICFEHFINTAIIPHIETLEFFRNFSKSLEIKSYESISSVPQSYRCYDSCLKSIINPIYKKIIEIEDKVREQETTYTLLNLAEDLQELLEPVHLLKKIHNEVITDFCVQTNLSCTSTLIVRLHDSLFNSTTKLDQDLRLTLLLYSLQHYFSLIDAWLMKDDLADHSEEFLIVKVSDSDVCELNFVLQSELDPIYKENGIIKIIIENVLQIGRNLHLLRLLDKFSFLNDSKENIHQELVRKILEDLCKYFDIEEKQLLNKNQDANDDGHAEAVYQYPVICTEQCKKPIEMDKLDNLVDISDGFLMLAFEEYFTEKPETPEIEELTLFEKISSITTTFFPVMNFFEKNINGILKERFTYSGLMVKTILNEKYLLEKQFQFLRHLFLFFDDLIFPFYRRLFEKASVHSKNWGNDIWLTSQLQDIIIDMYPEFYEKCIVHVDKNWKLCFDPSEACNMISLQYEITWPLNIIISSSQMNLYKDIFRFVLKLKWFLYTVNHLSFTDLQPKTRRHHRTKSKTHRTTIMKLKYLKFALTNLMNSIQHYIFSFIFTKCLKKFELEFEKANDLSSIMSSHSEFINSINSMLMDIQHSDKDTSTFSNLTTCLNKLNVMWNNMETAAPERLQDCYNIYKQCYDTIIPKIYPVYIFDY